MESHHPTSDQVVTKLSVKQTHSHVVSSYNYGAHIFTYETD